MRLRDFWSLCSVVAFSSLLANAQIVTVTTHISACSATYPSRSTKVIVSTVTVAPTPWSDTLPNGGTPFVIRLQQVDTSGYPDQISAPYWLMVNGNTTTDISMAGIYRISNGQLRIYNGSYISTGFGVVDQAFAIAPGLGPISTYFSVTNSMLNWTNTQFSSGTAQFYKLPPGLLQIAQILAKFVGPMEAQRSWSPVILYVDPVPSSVTLPELSSAVFSPSRTDVVSSGVPAQTSSGTASSSSLVSPSGPILATSLSSSTATQSSAFPPANATYTGPFVSPTALSRAGRCGGITGEYCSGSGFGNCCSRYGWCGSTNHFCSTGCQIDFGSCNADQSSISSISLTTETTSATSVSSTPISPISSPGGSSVAVSVTPSLDTSTEGVPEVSTFRGSTITPMSITFSSMPITSNGLLTYSTTLNSTTSAEILTSSPTVYSSLTVIGSAASPVSSVTGIIGSAGSSIRSTSSSSVTPVTTAASSASISSLTSSAPSPAATTCTQGVLSDAFGALYAVNCGSDSTVAAFATVQTDNGVQGCISICSSNSNCLAVTFAAFDSTMKGGFCYLRPSEGTIINSGPQTAFIVLVQPASSSISSTRTSLSTTTPSSIDSSSVYLTVSEGSGSVNTLSSTSQSTSLVSPTHTSGSLLPSSTSQSIPSAASVSQSSSSPTSSTVQPSTSASASASSTSTSTFSNSPLTITDPISTDSSSTTAPSSVSNSGAGTGSATVSATASSYSSSYTCPSTNYVFTTDAQGKTYKVYTDVDADGSSDPIFRTEVGTSECMSRCDITPGCTGWTYRGFDTSQAAGYCYLRTTVGQCRPGASGVLLGILVGGSPAPYPSTSSISSSRTSSSPTISQPAFSSYVPPVRTSSSSSSSYVNPLVASNTANVIPAPTLCDFGDPPSYDQDDNYCEINLPFSMQIYGYSDTHTFASTNGFVSLTNGSSAFDGGSLPSIFLPPYSICPWFDDLELYVSRNQNQGIYYSTPNDNSVYYEWILSRPQTQEIYHFTAFYEQAVPGVFTYRYYTTGGDAGSMGADGGTASVGAQGVVNGEAVAAQFSFDEKVLKARLQVRCDTGSGKGSCVVIS